jgi:hypothetical protein
MLGICCVVNFYNAGAVIHDPMIMCCYNAGTICSSKNEITFVYFIKYMRSSLLQFSRCSYKFRSRGIGSR